MELKQRERHWTEEDSAAFAHRLAFDFITQIEKRMEELPISQIALARKLGVSEGAVSKLLNNPQNLTLRTIAKYSRALGIKAAIVAYNDGDSQNKTGPIASEVFSECWQHAGRPRDAWAMEAIQYQQAATTDFALMCGIHCGAMLTAANFASNNGNNVLHERRMLFYGSSSTQGTTAHKPIRSRVAIGTRDLCLK